MPGGAVKMFCTKRMTNGGNHATPFGNHGQTPINFAITPLLTMPVDELHKALAELDQLERQERHLRKAIEAQKLKIDRLGPTTINRLPPELLSQIFTLCIPDPKFPEESLNRIVGVSRRWRDVVWNNPSFWTFIKVTQIQHKKSLEKQLERSGKALLDIWIEGWDYRPPYDRDQFHALLGAIVPHANCWRSLTINTDSMEQEFVESFLTEFDHLSITSLQEFTMDIWDNGNGLPYLPYPDFLSPLTRTPALQHLTLKPSFQLDTFMALPTLKTLHLTFAKADHSPPVISMLTPAQSLTSLVLDGGSAGWSLKRNDLHLPLLDHLTLHLDRPIPFLEAIVAPKLRYVRCCFYDPVEFNAIERKFRDVHDLSLEANGGAEESLCRAFPGVRQVCLSVWDTQDFLMAGINRSAGVLERRPPIDQWLNLETVTLDGVLPSLEHWGLDNPIVKWLRGRQESGLPRLRVRLPQRIKADRDRLPSLLGRYCNLEMFTDPM